MSERSSFFEGYTPCLKAGTMLQYNLIDITANTYGKNCGSKKGFIMYERLRVFIDTQFMKRGVLDMMCETRHFFSLHLLARVWGWIRGPLGLTDTFLGLLKAHHCIGIRDEEYRTNWAEHHAKQMTRVLEAVAIIDGILAGTPEALAEAEALDLAKWEAIDEKEQYRRRSLDDKHYEDLQFPDLDAVCQTERALRFETAKRREQLVTWKSSDAALLELLEPSSKKKKRTISNDAAIDEPPKKKRATKKIIKEE